EGSGKRVAAGEEGREGSGSGAAVAWTARRDPLTHESVRRGTGTSRDCQPNSRQGRCSDNPPPETPSRFVRSAPLHASGSLSPFLSAAVLPQPITHISRRRRYL